MKKFGLMAVFIVFLVLSFSSVEGQIRTEARTAGYHNFTYTNYIQNLDTSIPAIYVWPSTFVIGGNNPGTSMQIVGSAGSYTFNSIAAGSIFSFSDPVTVNGLLRVNSDTRAVRFCDISGANCFNGSTIIGIYNNITNLQSLWYQNGGNVYRSSGFVGIGTNSPSYTLDTTSSGSIRGGSVVTGTVTASGFINANGGLTSTGNFIIRLS